MNALTAQFRESVGPMLKDDLRRIITPFYELTLTGWRGTTGRPDGEEQQWARPVFPDQLDIKVRLLTNQIGGGVRVVMTSLVLRQDGAPHNLWYWLDRGTDTVESWGPKRSAPFRNVNYQRTGNDSLTPGVFGGYQERVVAIPVGGRREGIDPRRWSEKIGDEMRSAVPRAVIAGLSGWEVTNVTFVEPELSEV